MILVLIMRSVKMMVPLPPDKVDIISDEEDIDEDDLGAQNPSDIPGSMEIHDHTTDAVILSTNTVSSPPSKRMKNKTRLLLDKGEQEFPC